MKFEIYASPLSTPLVPEWRWRLRADNGRVIADSSESHFSRDECHREVRLVQAAGQLVPIVEASE